MAKHLAVSLKPAVRFRHAPPPRCTNMKSHTEFFNTLAIECGITDVKTVRLFYYALAGVLFRSLRKTNFVEMPDWGKFSIKPHASRRIHDLQTGGTKELPPINTIRFEADYKLKAKIRE